MRANKISDTMRDVLRAMAETGAQIEWDGYNRWRMPDGKEEFRIYIETRSTRAPTATVSDALERRGLIERISPAGSLIYAITEKGKEAIK